jgi:hypothetical protein
MRIGHTSRLENNLVTDAETQVALLLPARSFLSETARIFLSFCEDKYSGGKEWACESPLLNTIEIDESDPCLMRDMCKSIGVYKRFVRKY